ncbi:MAG TPA: CarD family transcriptional regulator [Firmicutes bacterium]|jgi:CarD family transcriptional regulator|nr:CarD family transcriptional regulator [Bacillota bacterium]
MFNVGDKIVYPMHGAGVIEAIEEKEVLGEKRKYYVMHLPLGDMKVMIPTNSINKLGLREVIDEEGVQKVLRILKDQKTKMSSNWNRRYRANMEKIRSGDIYEVAEVVKNLSIRKREKGLSTGESKMLDSARQILISELVLAKDIEEDVAEGIIDELFE